MRVTGQARPRLGREYFNQPTLHVARSLLGKYIVRDDGERRITAMITETEAYKGLKDRACHTYGGRRTQRVEPLYGDGGTVYVYLVYGILWLLNFSTAGPGIPEGVLIRGIKTEDAGVDRRIVGPAKVTQFLCIDNKLNGENAADSEHIRLEDHGIKIPMRRIKTGPRVGVSYAGPYWATRPWRFWLEY